MTYSVAARLTAGVVFLGMADMPYDYYTILRIIVTGMSIWGVYLSSLNGRNGWRVFFIVLAFLFNPIVPVFLDKASWIIIDFGVAVALIGSSFVIPVASEDASAE